MENFLLLPRAIVSSLFDAGMAGVVGALLARAWLGLRIEDEAIILPLQRTQFVCSVVMVFALPLQLWLLAATIIGSSTPGDISKQLVDVLIQTHAGRVLFPDFFLSLLLVVVSIIRPLMRQRISVFLGATLVVILLAFRSASGHAAADGDFTVSEFIQFLHLSSISIWAGGVMIAGLVVLPRLLLLDHIEDMTTFGRRLSRASTVAVLLVALSGFLNAWRGLGASLHPLLHTQWGGLLALKSVLVGTALILGAANRFLLQGKNTLSPNHAARFSKRMRTEALVMIAVLLVSGWLAGSPPATGP